MYHYIALVWHPSDYVAHMTADQLARRLAPPMSQWKATVAADGMHVYVRPSRGRALTASALARQFGAVVGRLFARSPAPEACGPASLTEREVDRIIATGGRTLVDDYWGGYVAFFKRQPGDHALVIRDSSGRIPCYRTVYNGVHIIFADVQDLTPLGLPSFTLNRTYLAAFIKNTELQIRDSALSEVTELLAGDCFELRRGASRQFSLWDPKVIVERHRIDDNDEAVVRLRETVQQCIAAWSSVHDSILLSLSGGLDSAIVLGCLHKVRDPSTITGLNLFGRRSNEDERRYARAAAERAGVKLVEHLRDGDDQLFDERLFELPKSVKPSVPPLLILMEIAAINSFATGAAAESIWTGQGGDHLFLQDRNALGACDYIVNRGLDGGLPSAIADAARLSRRSYWSVTREAFKLAKAHASWQVDPGVDVTIPFLSEGALPNDTNSFMAHPWTKDTGAIPKGKRSQIHFLAEVVNRQRPVPGVERVYEHHPLLSQPLMETCLQIPSYLLTRGGRHRALARTAFQDQVPATILRREDKGGTPFIVTDRLRRSQEFLREFLLNGFLIREGIAYRPTLEAFLSKGATLRPEHCHPLLACLAAEVWVQSWARSSLRIAA